jgi:hypothetical protein
MNEFDRNEAVAEAICRDLNWNGRQFELGKHIALLDSEVVAETETPEEAIIALRSIDPRPSRGMVVPVRPTVLTVIR